MEKNQIFENIMSRTSVRSFTEHPHHRVSEGTGGSKG